MYEQDEILESETRLGTMMVWIVNCFVAYSMCKQGVIKLLYYILCLMHIYHVCAHCVHIVYIVGCGQTIDI